MITSISGKITEKRNQSVVVENNGISYEVFLPAISKARLDENISAEGNLRLITFHYHQIEPSRSIPVLIGFLSEVERDFFEVFITVSGIGPKAALRAINIPISSIAGAIDKGDLDILRSLPGIGPQRAKEIVAKLQGKIGRFGLIQDSDVKIPGEDKIDLIEQAVDVLMQLQYKKNEAKDMAQEALKKSPETKNVEELLNIIYKQRARR